ncbi:MAG: general secretion pathway protein B [Glaciecola sp.]|jgi:general secretion pathway protein B
MLKTFKVNDLEPGMMVNKVVSQHGPVKIRKVGIIRSPEMVKGLKEMGVTELEVDLSQSLGLDDDEVESTLKAEVKKLTPTQQLLQNERRAAKPNNDTSQQFNRSLFMPSMESLPSTWNLYGKNIALLSLLIVGGICIGWNIAAVPKWLSLIQAKNYVVIDYQAMNNRTGRSIASEKSDLLESNLTDRNSLPENNASSQVNASPQENIGPEATEQAMQASAQTEQLGEKAQLVLGYQPDNRIRPLNPIPTSGSQNLLTLPQEQENEPVISAALIDKFNKAIADLENESSGDTQPSEEINFEDLPRIDQLSVAMQTQLPSMAFSAHMYSSNREGRWVRVNGRRLIEGDYIAEDLQLVNIEPQTVILMFQGEVFTMNALTDW